MSRSFLVLSVWVMSGLAVGTATAGQMENSPSQKRYKAEVKTLSERFQIEYGRNELAKAEQTAQEVVQLAEHKFGPESPDMANALSNLAMVRQAEGKPSEEIEPTLQRVLAIREKALGPNHPDVAQALTNLGRHYRFHDARDKAKPLLSRALTIREQALGPNDPLVASSLHDLAQLYKDEERYAEAVPLIERELLIWERAMGEDHPMIPFVLGSYAEILRKAGEAQKAVAVENRLERMRRAREEARPPSTARPEGQAGVVR